MAKKKTNLQPWLDYFKMLQQYEAKGFLEIPEQREQNGTRSDSAESRRDSTAGQVKPAEHEAYITRAALLTLSPTPALPKGEGDAANGKALHDVVTRIRAYAAWRAAPAVGQQHPADMNDPAAPLPTIPEAELTAYFSQPFAVHIVKEDYPHDLLLTLLLQQKRSWRTAWRTVDTIEVIDYTEIENPT